MSSVDQRLQFIQEKILDAFPELGQQKVQAVLEDTENRDLVRSFLKGEEPKKLLFVFSGGIKENKYEDKITPYTLSFAKQDQPIPVNSQVLYIIRKKSQPIAARIPAILEQVITGVVDSDTLGTLENVLEQIYVPLLSAQENWGKAKPQHKEEFLQTVSKFSQRLSQVVAMERPVILNSPEPKYTFANTPQNIANYKNNKEYVQAFENVLKGWIQQTQKLLEENEKKQQYDDDEGPNSEIEFWKTRYATLNR